MRSAYRHELVTAIGAVCQASEVCRRAQADLQSAAIQKQDRTPVTIADFASQAIICRALDEAFPDDPIMAEEGAALLREPEGSAFLDQIVRLLDTEWGPGFGEFDPAQVCDWIDRGQQRDFTQRFWTLDPIDGTTGFLRGDQYAVALALIVEGRVVLSVVGCPNLPAVGGSAPSNGSLFYAESGEGAGITPLSPGGRGVGGEGAPPQRIHVSSQRDVAAARFCESVEPGHSWQEDTAALAVRLGITAPPLRLDGQVKYAVVARGDVEMYLRVPVHASRREKIWDHAPGVLLVTEAGGRVTDLDGRELQFFHGERLAANRGLLATNGVLHDAVLSPLGERGA